MKMPKLQNCFSWFLENQLVGLRFNRLFLSPVNKSNLKTNITEIRERDNHTTKFTLVHSYTKSYIQSLETTG